jgi:hypothetical protein
MYLVIVSILDLLHMRYAVNLNGSLRKLKNNCSILYGSLD